MNTSIRSAALKLLLAMFFLLASLLVQAQTPNLITSNLSNPAISAVLDGYYQNGDTLLDGREKGFGLRETELALSANISDMFYGKLTTVLEANSDETDIELEEAFIQTTAMPAGFTIRGGRFLSDVGYLNNQHLHTDAFVNRPALYRGFFGGHYFDDGIRINYVAPTLLYWSMGLEAFSGDKMRAEDEQGTRHYDSVGVYTAHSKIGGDIGNASWQLGLSYLRNQNGRLSEEEHQSGNTVNRQHDHEEEAGHSHNIAYTGENTYSVDLVYKWAPQGNYKYQHLTLSGEYVRVTDFTPDEDHSHLGQMPHHDSPSKNYHQGWYLSSVYQFSPHWSAGVRYGQLETQILHDDHFEQQKLNETDVMLAWHQSHYSTIRLQYSHQQGSNFSQLQDENLVTLQFTMTLGAHGAHQF